jgi:hypothetical protein
LWFVNFIILWGKDKDKNSNPEKNITTNNKSKKKVTSKKAK